MTEQNATRPIDWNNREQATQDLRFGYSAAGDFQAMLDLVVGGMTPREAATVQIYSYRDHDDLFETNDVDACIDCYERWFLSDLNEIDIQSHCS